MTLKYLLIGGVIVIVPALLILFWPLVFSKGKNKKKLYKRGLIVTDDNQHTHEGSDFILSAIEDGVVMVGQDNVIHLFNPAAAQISGWPAEEAVGLQYYSVLSLVKENGEPYPTHEHPFAKALQTAEAVRDSRGQLVKRDGRKLPISLIVSPIIEELEKEGQKIVNQVVGVFRDISKEKAEEQQRVEFISTASHEMRTPIAAIEGYISLALNEKVTRIDENARKYLDKAHSATKQLGKLFQDLLNSSKAEDGRLSSYPVVVEIGEIVEEIVDAARFVAQKKGLELNYIVSKAQTQSEVKAIRPLYFSFVDSSRFREVIQNIVDNALKYTQKGSVTVALTGDNRVVQIQVKDTGPGIPTEDIPHLFQKFYRVDNSMTRTIGGTGLGLFLAKKIIDLYNGHIWVESAIGKGSTFFINLPRLTTQQAVEAQKKQASQISVVETPKI